ncbi:MAG: hypothetical protein K2Y01_03855 [Rhabdochlamydiaceae bacterium]|nr:hypothetical protein [Rhabdochlamydiaceae bacterium]
MFISNKATPVEGTTPVEGITPSVTPITTDAVTKKTSIISRFTGLFSGSSKPEVNRNHLHQSRIIKVMSETQRKSDYLANQIAIDYKAADVETLIPFYRDLFYLPVDKAVVSASFETLIQGLKDNTITKLVGKASSWFAKAGKVHAEDQVKLTLLEGMQKGLLKTLQGKLAMDSEKDKFLESALNSLEQGLQEGSVDPMQALQEAGKIANDPMLNGKAQDPEAAQRIAKVQSDAAKQILDAEKTAAIETITGAYQQQKDRLDELKALFDKLQSLSNKPDSTVEESIQVNQEILEVTDQILSLMKELNIETTITTAGQIINPLSKNITEAERTVLNRTMQNEVDRIKLIIKEKTEENNAELVSKLMKMQGTRTLGQKAHDAVFGRTDEVSKTLQLSAANQFEIAQLKKEIAAFEKSTAVKTEVPAEEVKPGKSLTERLKGFIPTFSTSRTPSAEEKLIVALSDLENFEQQEEVQPVLIEQRRLDAQLQDVEGKKFSFLAKPFYAKAQKKAIEKATNAIVDLQTKNAEIFTKHAELTQAVAEAEAALPRVEEAVEEIDAAYFPNVAV